MQHGRNDLLKHLFLSKSHQQHHFPSPGRLITPVELPAEMDIKPDSFNPLCDQINKDGYDHYKQNALKNKHESFFLWLN